MKYLCLSYLNIELNITDKLLSLPPLLSIRYAWLLTHTSTRQMAERLVLAVILCLVFYIKHPRSKEKKKKNSISFFKYSFLISIVRRFSCKKSDCQSGRDNIFATKNNNLFSTLTASLSLFLTHASMKWTQTFYS